MTTDQSADDTVLDDVFATERDRGGKSAPPEAEAQPVAPPASAEPPQEQAQDPETGRMVPLSELTGERKKLKGKLEEESRARIAAETEARLLREQLQRASQLQPQHAPQRQQVQIPDPITDPENYARFVHQSTEARLFEQTLNFSERMARREHGKQLVDEALAAAQAAGLVANGHFLQSAPDDPWGAMVEWHKQQKVLAEVGADPSAYRKKIEDEVRAKVLEELKAGNGPGNAGAQPQRFPGTLAEATAAGKQGAHLTDEAVMGAVFSSDRDRRK